MRDATDGDMDGTRWLSYAELAEARGISKRSAIRLTFRHRWQRQKGNDGTVRVAVPMSELERRSDGTAVIDDDRGVNTHADSGIIKALAAAVLELQERAERDKVEITRERSRADAFEVQARELLTTLSAMRDNVAQLREERATANAKADAAETRVDDLMAQVRELGEGGGPRQGAVTAARGRSDANRGGTPERRRARDGSGEGGAAALVSSVAAAGRTAITRAGREEPQ